MLPITFSVILWYFSVFPWSFPSFSRYLPTWYFPEFFPLYYHTFSRYFQSKFTHFLGTFPVPSQYLTRTFPVAFHYCLSTFQVLSQCFQITFIFNSPFPVLLQYFPGICLVTHVTFWLLSQYPPDTLLIISKVISSIFKLFPIPICSW